jgi:hypothetical protein
VIRPQSVTFNVVAALQSPTQRFVPAPLDGYIDVDLAQWDDIPRRGQVVTIRQGSIDGTARVKYRRRYPERGYARVWFVDAHFEQHA